MFKGETLSLLISLAIMHNPTCDMPTLWVMVCPMDETAFSFQTYSPLKRTLSPTFSPAMRGATSMLCVISSVCPDAS